jgi:hypothetical protein
MLRRSAIFAAVLSGGAPAISDTTNRMRPDAAPLARDSAVSARSVFWVGHSLINSRAQSGGRDIDLITLVGTFASHAGIGYSMGDHTLYGSPLSALWRGQPHSYKREAGVMAWRRTVFQAEASRYDTLLLTEAVPLAPTIQLEHSAYYLQQFYCALRKENPKARVYLFESWVNLHADNAGGKYGPPSAFRWRQAMLDTRRVWDRLAEEAVARPIMGPRLRHRLRAGLFGARSPCALDAPIYTVPVGQALVLLLDRLLAPAKGDDFHLPGGGTLTLGDLFANVYKDWTQRWFVDGSGLVGLDAKPDTQRLRDPTQPMDDIHPSAIGIYFNALVHHATFYRRSPVGLPLMPEIGPKVSRTLQCIAWEAVRKDPRSGVAADATTPDPC